MNGDDDCPLCLEPLGARNQGLLYEIDPCRHVFHINCLDEWRRTHNTCPNCRSEIRGVHIR